MKKITSLFAVLLIVLTNAFAQTDSVKTKLYTAIGISIGHVDPSDASIDNFNKASYPSLEIGLSRKNLSLGAVFGFENLLVSSQTRGFYELKTSISQP